MQQTATGLWPTAKLVQIANPPSKKTKDVITWRYNHNKNQIIINRQSSLIKLSLWNIQCSKCKFDFCWVCLDSWKKHSSATGGYFRCNRYEAMHKADEKQGSLISEAGQRNKKLQVHFTVLRNTIRRYLDIFIWTVS